MIRCSNTGRGKRFLSSLKPPDRLCLLLSGHRSSFPGVVPGIKNEWSCTSLPVFAFMAWAVKTFPLYGTLTNCHFCQDSIYPKLCFFKIWLCSVMETLFHAHLIGTCAHCLHFSNLFFQEQHFIFNFHSLVRFMQFTYSSFLSHTLK
jgi:hypothetical protein